MANDPARTTPVANPFTTGGHVPHSAMNPGWQAPGPTAVNPGGDSTGGLIPYKNPKALIAYYLGILALLPLIGFPFGIASLVLGVMGLKDRARNPVIKGSVHAWIGIVLGAGSILLYGALIVFIILGVSGAFD